MAFDYNLHLFRSSALQSIVYEAIEFFSRTPVYALPPPNQFLGSGVYYLYYVGNYALYKSIAQGNNNVYIQPIYVGKSVPPGWRTARISSSETSDLFLRLREHTRSIQQGANLSIEDFRCRFMILNGIESDLIGPVEAQLIRKYTPL